MNTVATEAAVLFKNILVMVTLLFNEERREQSPHLMRDRSGIVPVKVAPLEPLARKQTVVRIRVCFCATERRAQICPSERTNLFGKKGNNCYHSSHCNIVIRHCFVIVKQKVCVVRPHQVRRRIAE